MPQHRVLRGSVARPSVTADVRYPRLSRPLYGYKDAALGLSSHGASLSSAPQCHACFSRPIALVLTASDLPRVFQSAPHRHASYRSLPVRRRWSLIQASVTR